MLIFIHEEGKTDGKITQLSFTPLSISCLSLNPKVEVKLNKATASLISNYTILLLYSSTVVV